MPVEQDMEEKGEKKEEDSQTVMRRGGEEVGEVEEETRGWRR